jgi:hypothetical protein
LISTKTKNVPPHWSIVEIFCASGELPKLDDKRSGHPSKISGDKLENDMARYIKNERRRLGKRKPSDHQLRIRFLTVLAGSLMVTVVIALLWWLSTVHFFTR